MHYGTVIPEVIRLIDELTSNQVTDPIIGIIKNYKGLIRKSKLKDELYKWELLKKYQGRPDLSLADFSTEIKNIDYSNLIYQMAKAVRNHIANSFSVEYHACFVKLFKGIR